MNTWCHHASLFGDNLGGDLDHGQGHYYAHSLTFSCNKTNKSCWTVSSQGGRGEKGRKGQAGQNGEKVSGLNYKPDV